MKEIITCMVCDKQLKGRQLKFCSFSCKNSVNQSYHAQQTRGLKRKLQLIKKMGNKCSICGCNKNLSALTFHHIKPAKKNFQLDMRSLSNRTQSRIDKKLKNACLSVIIATQNYIIQNTI